MGATRWHHLLVPIIIHVRNKTQTPSNTIMNTPINRLPMFDLLNYYWIYKRNATP